MGKCVYVISMCHSDDRICNRNTGVCHRVPARGKDACMSSAYVIATIVYVIEPLEYVMGGKDVYMSSTYVIATIAYVIETLVYEKDVYMSSVYVIATVVYVIETLVLIIGCICHQCMS